MWFVCLKDFYYIYSTFTLDLQVKELPTYKDTDFKKNMQKVYVSGEEKEKIMEKLRRDTEVTKMIGLVALYLLHTCALSAVSGAHEDHGLQPAAGHSRCRAR